jgi:hypothetical protein
MDKMKIARLPFRLLLRAAISGLPALMMFACCAPNKCWQAKVGFTELERTIEQIDSHRAKTGAPPESLSDLGNISEESVEDSLVSKCHSCKNVKYRKNGDLYEVEFGYFRPGNNKCVYSSEKKKWACSGSF